LTSAPTEEKFVSAGFDDGSPWSPAGHVIGRACALRLTDLDARVAVLDGAPLAVQADLSDPRQRARRGSARCRADVP
jgi:hypothetical protein